MDLTKRRITVRRNRVSVRGRVIEQQTAKTKAGLRTVALSDFAVASLLAWQLPAGPGGRGWARGMADPGPRFHNGRRPSARSELCDAAIPKTPQGRSRRAAGDEFPRPPTLCASLMLASGADIAVVSKLLGHANIAITADVYGHLVGTIAQKAVDGAANLIAHTVHTHEEVEA